MTDKDLKRVPDAVCAYRHGVKLPELPLTDSKSYHNPSLFRKSGLYILVWILGESRNVAEIAITNPTDGAEAWIWKGTFDHIVPSYKEFIPIFKEDQGDLWKLEAKFKNKVLDEEGEATTKSDTKKTKTVPDRSTLYLEFTCSVFGKKTSLTLPIKCAYKSDALVANTELQGVVIRRRSSLDSIDVHRLVQMYFEKE